MRELHIEGERYATARANDDFEIAAVIAGEVVGLIYDVPKTGDLIRRMVGEARSLLERRVSDER